MEGIVGVAVKIHSEHESNCVAKEQDIQYHLAENCKRRGILEDRLQESAKKAQGVFANLLSLVTKKH